jgi:hypothetical protein
MEQTLQRSHALNVEVVMFTVEDEKIRKGFRVSLQKLRDQGINLYSKQLSLVKMFTDELDKNLLDEQQPHE